MKFTARPVLLIFTALFIALITSMIIYLQRAPLPDYMTAPARLGDIEGVVLAIGRIDAIERVNVNAQVSGQLTSLKVRLGDHVTKDQPIAEIDDLPQRNELRHAEAALNVVKAELTSKQALLKQAVLRFKRQRQMLNEDAGSREDLESAEAQLATARAELLSLNARLIQAQIDVDKKKGDLSYTRVLAPMDGVVIAVVTQQGQTLNPNHNASTIIRLARMDMMTINAQISEVDIPYVYPGQKAYFTLFSEPGQRYSATLRTLEQVPESRLNDDLLRDNGSASASGTPNTPVYYNALFEVPNPENKLRIGMTAPVTLVTGEAKNSLLVPIQAIQKRGANKPQVLVLTRSNTLETREVTTGITNNVDIQILTGLNAGENVVLSQPTDKPLRNGVSQ